MTGSEKTLSVDCTAVQLKAPGTVRASHTPRTVHLRVFKSRPTCVVSGFEFAFVHKLEGKWSGESRFVDLSVPSSSHVQDSASSHVPVNAKAASTKVTFHEEGYWTLRETTAGVDGVATVRHFRLTPASHGMLSVELLKDECDEGVCPFDVALTLSETSYGAQLVGTSVTTGNLEVLELITLDQEEGTMTRTFQKYVQGALQCMWCLTERKVE